MTCFAKMFVIMVAKLVIERAIMLGTFTGSQGPVVQSISLTSLL